MLFNSMKIEWFSIRCQATVFNLVSKIIRVFFSFNLYYFAPLSIQKPRTTFSVNEKQQAIESIVGCSKCFPQPASKLSWGWGGGGRGGAGGGKRIHPQESLLAG